MDEPTNDETAAAGQNSGKKKWPELDRALLRALGLSKSSAAAVIEEIERLRAPLEELEKFALRFGWGHGQVGSFQRWLEMRIVAADSLEAERRAVGESKAQFTRWWMAHREQTMHDWMRYNAPEDVRQAYFSIVANGSAQFLPAESKHLEIRQADGKVATALLEAADEAITSAQTLRAELAQLRVKMEEIRAAVDIARENCTIIRDIAPDGGQVKKLALEVVDALERSAK